VPESRTIASASPACKTTAIAAVATSLRRDTGR
jgi:hypothetical protein